MKRPKSRNGLLLLIAMVLVFSMTLTAYPNHDVQAKTPHVLYSVEYETVYYNPKDVRKAENEFWLALILLHPTLSKTKKLATLLSALGLKQAWDNIEKSKKKKADTRYVIEKLVYKSKKPTSYYWGYTKTNIYNADTKIKYYGKAIAIGKTSY